MKKNVSLRIIGGRWKSRRIRCAATAGLRPSPDAVRETLFNWLPHELHHKSCLDLFAGSGAFGFEAASRGAAKVLMVESNPAAVGMLRLNRTALQGDAVEVFPGTVEKFLRRGSGKFDIVFLDPPFDSEVLESTCHTLQERGFLNPTALVYIESPCADCPLPIPSDWHIIRQKQCGRVQSTLVQV